MHVPGDGHQGASNNTSHYVENKMDMSVNNYSLSLIIPIGS